MEIHKPKPIHNWREFLKEIGVIVIGVSIALAGEQAVEHWREHSQYMESRDAMRTELANNLAILSKRSAISTCSQRRTAELSALLDNAEGHEPFDSPRWIGDASSVRLRFAAESDAGRSSLFSPGEQQQYSTVYGTLHAIDTEQDRERQAWARLLPLEGRTGVPPEMIPNLREALAQASFVDRRIAFLLGLAKAFAAPLALTVTSPDPRIWPDTWPHCLPLDTDRAEALRRSAYHLEFLAHFNDLR